MPDPIPDSQTVAPEAPPDNEANNMPDGDTISSVSDLLPTQDEGAALGAVSNFAPVASEVAAPQAPKRGRGRPKGSTRTAAPRLKPAGTVLPPPNADGMGGAGEAAKPSSIDPDAKLDAAATASANLIFNGGVFVFGEELGRPRDKAEAAGMKMAFRDYYGARGVPDIPPELGLALAVGAYVLPRVQHEVGKSRIQRLGEKLREWFPKKKATVADVNR